MMMVNLRTEDRSSLFFLPSILVDKRTTCRLSAGLIAGIMASAYCR